MDNGVPAHADNARPHVGHPAPAHSTLAICDWHHLQPTHPNPPGALDRRADTTQRQRLHIAPARMQRWARELLSSPTQNPTPSPDPPHLGVKTTQDQRFRVGPARVHPGGRGVAPEAGIGARTAEVRRSAARAPALVALVEPRVREQVAPELLLAGVWQRLARTGCCVISDEGQG